MCRQPTNPAGNQLDASGNCCDNAKVDACGVCNGTALTIDSLGTCCNGTLDAAGFCCNGVVDECGVCNGVGACNVKALLLASLPNAPLYLMVNSNSNKKLRGLIQDAVAAAITKVQGRTFDKSYVSITLGAVAKSTRSAARSEWTVVAGQSHSNGPAANAGDTASSGVGASPPTSSDAPGFSSPSPLDGVVVDGLGSSGSGNSNVRVNRRADIPWAGLIDTPAPDVFAWRGVNSATANTSSPPEAALPGASPAIHGNGTAGASPQPSAGSPGSPGVSSSPVAGAPGSAHPPHTKKRRSLAALVDAGAVPGGSLGKLNAPGAAAPGNTKGPQLVVPSPSNAPGTTTPSPSPAPKPSPSPSPSPGPAPAPGPSNKPTWTPPSPASNPAPPPLLPNPGGLANINTTSTTNNVLIDVLLRNVNPSLRVVPDTATVLLALQYVLALPIALPASKNVLKVEKVLNIRRTGTCGDGVCQVRSMPTLW